MVFSGPRLVQNFLMSRKLCSSNSNYKVSICMSHTWHGLCIINHLRTQSRKMLCAGITSSTPKVPVTAGRRDHDRYSWLIRSDHKQQLIYDETQFCTTKDIALLKINTFEVTSAFHVLAFRAGIWIIGWCKHLSFIRATRHTPLTAVLQTSDKLIRKRTCDYLPKMFPINLSKG